MNQSKKICKVKQKKEPVTLSQTQHAKGDLSTQASVTLSQKQHKSTNNNNNNNNYLQQQQ